MCKNEKKESEVSCGPFSQLSQLIHTVIHSYITNFLRTIEVLVVTYLHMMSCIDFECIFFDADRNFHRSTNTGAQLYGRARGGRGRGLVDDAQSVRRGTRTISQSLQMPKLPSQSTDQNLSDVGNEEWETASESSDVLAHHHTKDTKHEDSKSSANREAAPGGKRDTKKTFASYQAERSQRDNLSEPRSGGFNTDSRNGQPNMRSSSNGNGRMSQRGVRDQGSSRNSATPVSDAANKLVFHQFFAICNICTQKLTGFSFVYHTEKLY